MPATRLPEALPERLAAKKEILSNIPAWPLGEPIYENPFRSPQDIAGFRLEGQAVLSFPEGRLRLENALDPSLGQASNFVLWCPEEFPDHACFSWDFWPIREPGLCIFFFAAKGRLGEDIFSPSLPERQGIYGQYHHGGINALHLSYFRRKAVVERSFNTCNLRKSYGFHMVAQGADPIPTVADAIPPYCITIWKRGASVIVAVNDLAILSWNDDGESHGPMLTSGRVGFRQMAPLMGEYANFCVRPIIG